MTAVFAGLVLILVGGLAAMTPRVGRRTASIAHRMLVGAGCLAGGIVALRVLVSGESLSWSIRATVPGGNWVFGVDALSAVFLVTILGVGAACALSGVDDDAGAPPGRAALSAFAFAALLVAIALVVIARSIVVFFGAWEIMAITSYVLIVTHHESADVRRAGLIYLVATHTATLALFAMFGTWSSSTADWSFAGLAAASPSLSAGATSAILLLALVGFGFKAGLVPLHFWLPPAHAAAPSHVSALMSGIVIKTGIYGLLRVLLLLGGAPAWWGWLVLLIGTMSGVLGVLWALAQHDLKRLLAYHSVENIGIILMGIGIGTLGVAYGVPSVAILGFAGALLHTVNHALFKSLLFLGAGAVYRATGTRDIESLGGLARRMPLTWLAFAIGSAAIIGVPPFNGFISEWLVYQGLFASGESGALLRLALLGIPALALIGALALACFAKVGGVVFLGTPRTRRAAEAVEPGMAGLLPMGALATTCVALGVVPALGIALVSSAATNLTGSGAAALAASVISGATSISILAAATVALTAGLWFVRQTVVGRQSVRREATWACGYDAVTPRMQYTASSFAAPLLGVFDQLSGVRTARTARSVITHPIDLVLDGAALPVWRRLHSAALRLRTLQQGRLHVYLLYVMGSLLILLGYLALGPRS